MENKEIQSKVISSPIRWAGSKRKLLNEMLRTFDISKKVYIEPFIGSGIVFLNVLNNDMYDKYYINDINGSIYNFFHNLINNFDEITSMLDKVILHFNSLSLNDKESFYYETRKKYNTVVNQVTYDSLDKSVMFWLLMKAGFNGVYRLNMNGLFNVPFGKKKKIKHSVNELSHLREKFSNVKLYNMSYNNFIDVVYSFENKEQCFIYMDPPYVSKIHQKKDTNLYTNITFDHISFIDFTLSNLNQSTYIISMEDHELSSQIYRDKFMKFKFNDIIRSINPKKTFKAQEIGYSNFDLNRDDRL
jgi:DNA adenine methylase